MQRSKGFIFTLNNYKDEDEIRVQNIECKYLIYGREQAPTTGTHHLQGYIQFQNARYIRAVTNLFPKGTHTEIAKGSAEQNIKYTSKDGNTFEKGDKPLNKTEQKQLQIEDWNTARDLAKKGLFDDIRSDLYIRYKNAFHSIARDAYVCPNDLSNVCGRWIYGKSGAGKSKMARELYPDAYMKNPTTKWWDGYQNQEHVILDDFDKYMKGQAYYLKIWSDRYSFPAETKGSCAMIRPSIICITSQYHPTEIWDDEETLEAIRRRFRMTYLVEGSVENDTRFPNEGN
jgi:hypothetical protein